MRLNVFIAQRSGLSRRAADAAIQSGRVHVNGMLAQTGQQVDDSDEVTLDNRGISTPVKTITIMLNKPVGYVVSRDGQGSKTVYDLLPPELHQLKPVGRLDKDSSGLLLLTSDGQLANELTHPRYQKTKIYEVELIKPLTPHDQRALKAGVLLDDGVSRLRLQNNEQRAMRNEGRAWTVTMQEGRNRQIRRTFAALGYTVNKLHRTHFGPYALGELEVAKYSVLC